MGQDKKLRHIIGTQTFDATSKTMRFHGVPWWPKKHELPGNPSRILKEFNALCRAAGLPKQRFHDLRHACISLLGAQGVPVKVISEIVGHSDIRLTQNLYQHVYREAKIDAAAKMDQLLTRASAENPVATTVATRTAPERLN